ncbi:TRM11 family SAM-dependent methyltransferase [Granulicoccus sp. GXG6511]|uniref:TRM11 family SAM-dependent methyltransferase n=1 Tax=Granulicoccus sp. GXG6511 TaxID=3381351 RepID=UPI003D7D48F1
MSSPLDARLTAAYQTFLDQRPPGADEDVHMLPAVVDHVIERCSNPGDVVFDPFAGFGTTLSRALTLGRRALGIELLPERVDHIRRHIPGADIIEGDARELRRILAGVASQPVDLVLTSPPYMTATHHPADPLTAYEQEGGDYARYLHELGQVAAQCAQVIKPGGFVVWNVADIHHRGVTTELISDCVRVLCAHLTFVATVPIEWGRLPHDLVADALLVFQRPTEAPSSAAQ